MTDPSPVRKPLLFAVVLIVLLALFAIVLQLLIAPA
jgi:hypothetical protein